MILKKVITPSIFHKVRQLESFSKTPLFANSYCRLSEFGRTSTTLSNTKQCLNFNVLNKGNNQLAKFPTTTIIGTQINRNAATATGDHVRMWVFERVVAVALPIVLPAALITENLILDGLLSILVVMHTHWGLEAIIVDYARPSVVGAILPKLLHGLLIVLSAVTLCGLLILVNTGPGVSKSVKQFWAIGKTPAKAENAGEE